MLVCARAPGPVRGGRPLGGSVHWCVWVRNPEDLLCLCLGFPPYFWRLREREKLLGNLRDGKGDKS